MDRHQDFWLWAGGALIAVALTLVAVAGGLLAARDHYQFWGGPPMIAAYACGALAFLCFIAAVRDVPFPFGRVEVSSGTATDKWTTGEWTLVRANSNNDDHFPRIESAVDSFGNKVEPTLAGDENSLWAFPRRVLRPGQHVSFELEVSDPNGEDVAIRVLCGSGEAEVATSHDGIIVWNVQEENIADPTFVHIYARSQRTFHRFDDWDASANFLYRVLPRLAPKVQP